MHHRIMPLRPAFCRCQVFKLCPREVYLMVKLIIEEYQKITDKHESIVELLAMPDVADIDFEPPRSNKDLYRSADLS